ncbi:MAG TPA: M14 family metallopeptidase [Anaerolineales bacterium]|nr:M14 family metallopeptidase [Anaerolineales bacterium]
MTFLNVVEIESALEGLASGYPGMAELITLPYPTAEGRRSHAIRIGSLECYRTTVLIISGQHAREWGGPDICINFVADLLEAWALGTGLVYGGTSFSAAQLRAIRNGVEIVVFPNVNPDGRHHSQTTADALWRKNRNPASSGGVASRIGVDVNRNYKFLWDFPVTFAPSAVFAGTLASNDPGNDLYHGTTPFSEAESKNVRWLFERFPRIGQFIDIHSFGGDILYTWGDDENQSSTTAMNFMNGMWNGQRGLKGDLYGEYIAPIDLTEMENTADTMNSAITGVRGVSYLTAQSFFLPGFLKYPTSGASTDWAFSRHYADPSKRKVFSYAIEFNRTPDRNERHFFPDWAEMERIILDVDAGLVAFCLRAAPRMMDFFIHPCRLRIWLYRMFWFLVPPEIRGPYGLWARLPQLFRSMLFFAGAVTALRLLGRLFRRH